jgi:apolipoprotein N-acyltransferase
MWGVTFLIMWFASSANAFWEHAFDWHPDRGQLGSFVAVLLAIVLFGYVRLNFFAPTSQAVPAAAITLDDAVSQQASTGVDWLTFSQSTDAERAAARPQFEATIDQLLSRTETALRAGARIVAWQEGAGTVLEEDKQATLDRVAALAEKCDAYLEVSLGVLRHTQDQHFIYNQSILVDSAGTVRWTYDKTYPVIPVEWYVMVAGDDKLPAVDTPYGRLSTAICHDLHFPPLLRQAGVQNADILLAPYNDFHPWEAEDRVTAMFRAIENGLSALRPAGHGTSTIIDYEGRVLASQNFFTSSTGILIGALPTRGVRTLYSRVGDAFAYLCALGLIVLTGVAFVRRQPTPAE